MTSKIYDETAWLANNYNTDTAKYFMKVIQPGNQIWSVNRT